MTDPDEYQRMVEARNRPGPARRRSKSKGPALPEYYDRLSDLAALAARETIKKCGVKKGVIARQMGITASSLSAWIQGRRHIKVAHIMALADALEKLTGRRYSLDEVSGRVPLASFPGRPPEMPDPVDPEREEG